MFSVEKENIFTHYLNYFAIFFSYTNTVKRNKKEVIHMTEFENNNFEEPENEESHTKADEIEESAQTQTQSQIETEPKSETVTQENLEEHAMDASKETESVNHQEENTAQDATTKSADAVQMKKKKSSFIKEHKSALTIASCFVLAGVGGFGGSIAANHFNNSGATVIYKSTNSNSGSNSNSANASSMSVKEVADQTMNSVVEIKTESVQTGDFFSQAVTSGAGSGVIISADGYIVTNHHVIEGANKITVTTKDGKEYDATLIGTDATTDLAVIKITAKDLTPAVLGSSGDLQVGDTAIAIGNPLGELGGTVTNGIISALDRAITIDGESMHLLQTNAAINPGNSGGGLFNDQGELIGIVNAKSSGSNIEGLGFAIPIDIAQPVIESLIKNGKVEGRPELGVTLADVAAQNSNPFSQNGGNATSPYIYNVTPGKAADLAGLQRGDKIISIDGTAVANISEVKSMISSHKAGDKITMKIERDGKEMDVEITLLEASTATTEKTGYHDNLTNS